MKRAFLLLLPLLAAGCTSQAGPFVTNIRYAGPGLLSVEKCMVEFSQWTKSVSTEDCSNEVIAVRSPMPPMPAPPPPPVVPPPPEM